MIKVNLKRLDCLQLEVELQRLAHSTLQVIYTANKEHYIYELNAKKQILNDSIDQQDLSLVSSLDAELVKLQTKQKKLVGLYLDDEFDKATLDEMREEVNVQMQEVEAKKADAVRTNAEILSEIKQIDIHIDDLKHMRFTAEVNTISDVLKYLSKIVVENGTLLFKFKLFEHIKDLKPIDFIALRQVEYEPFDPAQV
jgi:hypothetical protein